MLLITTGGGVDNDLVSLIDAEHYFAAQKVTVNGEEMVARAGKEPKDGKTQVEQLLAIRWLGEHAAMVRTDAKVRALLVDVAGGKKGQDPAGFARECAAHALALIDGKEPVRRPIPADSLRVEAFAWFPKEAGKDSFLLGIDLRSSGAMKIPADGLARRLPREMERAGLHKFAAQVGNVRLDRLSVVFNKNGKEQEAQVLLRATGAFEHQRLVDAFKESAKDVKQTKGPAGEPITFFQVPIILSTIPVMVVGDTDVVVRFSDPANKDKPYAELEEVLEVRAGKKDSAVKGPFADVLKQTPDQALALALGQTSKETRDEISKGAPKDSPPVPHRFSVFVTRDTAVRVSGRATMADAAEARIFAGYRDETIGQYRGLLNAGIRPELKETFALVIKVLECVKVESRDADVSLKAAIPAEVIQAVRALVEQNIKK
jgi:hypothetical protein